MDNFDNSEFFRGNIRLKEYVGGRLSEVGNYQIPVPSTKNYYDPYLFWLGLCIDGSNGVLSSRPANQFY
jgi:hypothetical protein